MFEWAKQIFGDSYTEDVDKKLAAEIGKHFVARADYNGVNEAKKTLEAEKAQFDSQLKERDKQLEELKKVDAAGLQAKITELQAANTEAQKAHAAELAKARKEFAIESRLLKEGAVNTKAVRALLDDSKIAIDGENIIGLDEQLKTLKESEKWAFAATQQTRGSGEHTGDGGGGKELTKEQEMTAALYGRK